MARLKSQTAGWRWDTPGSAMRARRAIPASTSRRRARRRSPPRWLPIFAPAHALRTLVLLNDHRFAEAAKLSRETLARDPNDLVALGALADAELELGKLDAALEATQRMLDIKPNLPSYSRAAYLRWLSGDGAEAKRLLRLAI